MADIPAVVGDIHRLFNDAGRLVVVVSAFEGRTADLIAKAREGGLHPESPAYASFVSAGEHECAAVLKSALTNSGLESIVITPRRTGFIAEGPRDDAFPKLLDRNTVYKYLDATPILVLPGFCAIDRDGVPLLLGRGGSDISAVHMAAGLGVPCARLVKDVDAVYERDPNKFPGATRLLRIDYHTALIVGGDLIQPKALRYAAETGVAIELAAVGKPPGTLITK